jgi:hypothetical protein
MNLILGNFDDVVKFVHPVEVRGARSVANDGVLQTLALGIALAMQRACRRSFGRAVNELYVTSTTGIVILPRYPVETVTLVEHRESYTGGWTDRTNQIEDLSESSGVLTLDLTGRVRITYTGGYFANYLEPDEAGYPTALPTGAKPMPEDLRMAWLLAVQNAWEHKDHWIPKNLGGNAEVSPLALNDLADNLPVVAQAITDYRRMML